MEDEVLDVSAVEAVGEFLSPYDGVVAGVEAPGGVDAEAEAWGVVLEDVGDHGFVAEPVVAAVVVDAEVDVVLVGELDGVGDAVGHFVEGEGGGDHGGAGSLGEFEPAFFDGGGGEALDTDGGDLDASVFKGGEDVVEGGFVVEVGVDAAELDAFEADGFDLGDQLVEGLEGTEAPALDGEFFGGIEHESILRKGGGTLTRDFARGKRSGRVRGMKRPAVSETDMLGPYRVLRTLGEGGMGTVYLAHDVTLERDVAIKVLRVSNGRVHAGLAKRFLREAKTVAKLTHPNVVTIFTIGTTGEGESARPYIVMQYIEGGSLADQLHRHGPLGWRDSVRVIMDALRGLGAAHAAKIIHRDVKPANLMRGPDGLVKLVDFGLARWAEGGEQDLTVAGAFVGSPSYASPEQIAANRTVDQRSDLYSLAATWYALLTRQPPFVAEDTQDVMRMHLLEVFPDVRALAPEVPEALVKVLRKASVKRVEDRYQSAAEMLADVEGLLQERSVERPVKRPLPAPRLVHAEKSVVALEGQLAEARSSHDVDAQLTALRSLYGLYAQLERRDEANRAFREAIKLHALRNDPRSGIRRAS